MSWQENVDRIVDEVVTGFDDMEDDDAAGALQDVIEGLEKARGMLLGEDRPINTRYTFTCFACPVELKTNDSEELFLITQRHKEH